MKNRYFRFLAVLIVLFFGFSVAFAERVSPEDAALVAGNFMKAGLSSQVKKAPAKPMVLKKAPAADETRYYVYENANGEGWVMIAADDAVTPVLAYSNTGTFRTDNQPVNVKAWLGKYNKFIQKIETDGVEADEETAGQWQALRSGARKAKGDAVVGPLIQTTWDQDSPYWNLCPGSGSTKAYTGCVATAMAQVMNYWQWPVKGTGSRTYQPMDPNSDTGAVSKRYGEQSADFGNTTYDWANMKNSYQDSYTSDEATAVATLMYHCGVATEMMYGNDADGGSGTYTINYGEWDWGINEGECAQNAFANYFKYKKSSLTGYMRDGYEYGNVTYYEKWSDADWTAMIKGELDKKHPIMYGGAGTEGGHSFICDGYDDSGYFHFNWGWSGSNDGYYKLSSLKPGSGGAGGGSYDFSEDQDVLIGIVPDKKDLPKVTVTWSVAGEESTTEFTQEDELVLPTDPADCESGKVFVGWTKESTVDGEKPADLFKTATGKSVTEAVTYYAVFAEAEGVGETEVASVTFKTAASDGNQDVSTDIKNKLVDSDSGISSYNGSKLYVGKEGAKFGASKSSGSLTMTLSETAAVTKVVVNGSQYGTDTGKLKVTIGTTELDPQSPTTNMAFVPEEAVEANSITIETTSKRAYVASVSVIAGGVSYSEYSLFCDDEPTDVQAVATKSTVLKQLVGEQLFIIRDGGMYTVTGVRVK